MAYIEQQSTPCPMTGCWLWNGGVNAGGYGILGLLGRNQRAHRVSFEEFNGPIPHGMYVLHRCNVHSCVNPNHLYAGNSKDNANDRVRIGRGRGPRVKQCKYGHQTTEPRSRNKWGHCLTCYKILVNRKRETYARRKVADEKG